jgi:hypothetical protein
LAPSPISAITVIEIRQSISLVMCGGRLAQGLFGSDFLSHGYLILRARPRDLGLKSPTRQAPETGKPWVKQLDSVLQFLPSSPNKSSSKTGPALSCRPREGDRGVANPSAASLSFAASCRAVARAGRWEHVRPAGKAAAGCSSPFLRWLGRTRPPQPLWSSFAGDGSLSGGKSHQIWRHPGRI